MDSNIDTMERVITFSRNIFLPLTWVCRNRCGYCTFRKTPGPGSVMMPEEVERILRLGSAYHCTEALFTFGERPEEEDGFREYLPAPFRTILEYASAMAEKAIAYGILPHTNAGILTYEDMKNLREVNASMGLMLETTADIPAHLNSPGKRPERRIQMMEEAGQLKIPFTTGLLLGIGESRADWSDSLTQIADLHARYDHIQEVIIQNFCPKPGTRMEELPGATLEMMIDAVSLADEILPADISVQIPPNLTDAAAVIKYGVTDLGGVSPVTIDYVNPEHPWPQIDELKSIVGQNILRERLCIYQKYIKKGWYSERLKDLIISLEEKITNTES